MEAVIKSRELIPGAYTVECYEPTKSSYGVNYLVTAEHESKERVKFWSNGYLSDFISSRKPVKKFKIEYVDSKMTIPGYSRKVILN
jgi:hypothetical protein